jgi:glycerol-3-phosphate acyltransferase PlsY
VAAGTLPIWTWYLYSLLLTEREKIAADEGPVDIFTPGPVGVDEPVRWPFIVLTVLLAVVVIWKHQGNLERLANGSEPKLGTPIGDGPDDAG